MLLRFTAIPRRIGTMRELCVTVLLCTAVLATATAPPPDREVDNLVAFARLYGVARYFYPSDAAASLDWDAFAVHGVKQVRAAADPAALEATLERLFTPLGRGIEIGRSLGASAAGAPDKSLIAWRYVGPGLTSTPMGPYRGKRTNRPLIFTTAIDGFATVMQMLPAHTLRGKNVRLRGRVRATSHDSAGAAALWLRVDRPGSKMGFFDNMGDRPIRDPQWREYTIEGAVADDATNVAIGAIASGAVTADFDAIALTVQDGNGWTPADIKDGSFEAPAASPDWSRAGNSRNAQVTRLTERAPEGQQFLRIGAPTVPPVTAEIFDAPPIAGAHVDVDLGSQLHARVPLSLTDAAAASTEAKAELASLQAALQAPPATVAGSADKALADMVVAWNVFRHFYPYWTEVEVDWDARLRPLLESALAAKTRTAHRDTLSRLVADVRDGHGRVVDLQQSSPPAMLPLRFGFIQNQVVVTASSNTQDVPVGAVVSAIDTVPAAERLINAMELASGSPQWKQARALAELSSCEKDRFISLTLDGGSGSQAVRLLCDGTQATAEKRPEPIAELSAGVWYVDLSRASMAQIRPMLEKLAQGTGIVFDLRGYPTDAGAQILSHLVDAPENDRWMHIAEIVGPFGQTAGWQSAGWNLQPRAPHFGGKIVFMTDGRAISYAESVMGYVKDRKLGTIVGSATAGANGNVVRFQVPGGFSITFTGMRVTGHDGHTPHHLRGVQPDVPAGLTTEGLRQGRDEVLERALDVIKK
jgi:hypothetical protein